METMPIVERLAAVWKSALPRQNQRRSMTSAADRENHAVAAFAATVDALGELRNAPTAKQQRVLTAMHNLGGAIDLAACESPLDRYGRRVLVEQPAWSLAAIMLRYGQETESHNHGGWGGVVTVRGIERDRRFLVDNGELILAAERDYRPGTGYVFEPTDIHQPSGADPLGVTVALHFLVNGDGTTSQSHQEGHAQTR
jgi:predicted metal-dependent enzyme (double-stranded beta helix superfamily)